MINELKQINYLIRSFKKTPDNNDNSIISEKKRFIQYEKVSLIEDIYLNNIFKKKRIYSFHI